ncbi:MAG: NADH-quinone oxidoreductase subunit J [Acidobacteria bacterium]|nr:NADH-quinone oxidoreductase subunit J [Acidobacteriota bacterium]MBI3655178.1 NADH-quinone oxidoreductase subunit J [Acidobacteriota bacterium]
MDFPIFIVFGGLALGAAISVVAQRRAIYSALSLLICLGALAVLFAQLSATFIAMIQIIVYAGAIMVLFLTVVMLLDPRSDLSSPNRARFVSYAAIPLALALGLILLQAVPGKDVSLGSQTANLAAAGRAEEVGRVLFSKFLLPFEATSILILVAILGAVVLAKRKL